MQAAGAIRTEELPDFDEDTGLVRNFNSRRPPSSALTGLFGFNAGLRISDDSDNEDVEIEMVENLEPAFLRKYGRQVKIELEPVKVVKNPDGSLLQAALLQVGRLSGVVARLL